METREQIIAKLNNDILQLAKYYDFIIETMDCIVMRILKSRHDMKWREYTISLLKKEVTCDVAISKGISSIYLDFKTPFDTYIPVSFEVASKAEGDLEYRIDLRIANYSWLCARVAIEKERDAILAAAPNAELFYFTIVELRKLREIEPSIPKVFWSLVK